MINREEITCPTCGYPSHAEHSLDCVVRTEREDIAPAIEMSSDARKKETIGLYQRERILSERFRGRAREVALALAITTASLIEGRIAHAFEIRTTSEATSAMSSKGMELLGESVKFNDGHILKLNADGQTKRAWIQVIKDERTESSRIRITVENNDGSTDIIESSDGTKQSTTIDHANPPKKP